MGTEVDMVRMAHLRQCIIHRYYNDPNLGAFENSYRIMMMERWKSGMDNPGYLTIEEANQYVKFLNDEYGFGINEMEIPITRIAK